ncbi:hypothetical protein KUCAC02_029800 [Chaenocephalus aceratus]|nr:hypothetical protein KUCAC02_029800 [Chaenocephalus aceratus]
MSAASSPVSRIRPGWMSSGLKNRACLRRTAALRCSHPSPATTTSRSDDRDEGQGSSDLQTAPDSSFNDSVSHSSSGTPAAVPKLSNAQISEHYSTCIKLSTENKITTKNAFGLHLIDYMADILKQKDSELTNFKVAAGTLDASTKIYAVRVDAVHADAYRVLGGLGAETKPGEDQGSKDDENDGDGEATTKQRGKRDLRRRLWSKTWQTLTAPSLRGSVSCFHVTSIHPPPPPPPPPPQVDPMFQRMAASFDESSTAGVFLSVLFCENNRCELLFPSNMTLLQSTPSYSPPRPLTVPASPFMAGLQRSKEKTSICPSLQDFSFTSWDPEQTMNQLLEKMQQGDHVFDERGKEFMEGCEASGSGKGRDVIPIGEGDIATMCLQLSSQPREYSYFSPRTMAAWAGPGYWQFKPKHKLDHMPDKEPRKRKLKKPMEIDFNDDVNFDAFFRTTRAATTISKSALSVSNKKTTLPADFQFPPESLSQLNLKPSSSLTQEGQKRLSGELGEGIGDYDYNNANDTANFCPGLEGGDSDDDAEGFADDPSAESLPPPSLEDITTYGEQDLVPEPHRVNKIEINYAKTAKKMDMKRLKSGMWSLLTESPDNPSQETDAVEKTEVFGEKAFSQTTQILLQRLPNTMAQNLSVPLAFVALLHLANEKNLELVKVEDMSDIIIRQGH